MSLFVIAILAINIDRMCVAHSFKSNKVPYVMRNDSLIVMESDKFTKEQLEEMAELAKCQLLIVPKKKDKKKK